MFQNGENFPGAPKARPKKLTKIAISKGEINNCIVQNEIFFQGAPKARPKIFTNIAVLKGKMKKKSGAAEARPKILAVSKGEIDNLVSKM